MLEPESSLLALASSAKLSSVGVAVHPLVVNLVYLVLGDGELLGAVLAVLVLIGGVDEDVAEVHGVVVGVVAAAVEADDVIAAVLDLEHGHVAPRRGEVSVSHSETASGR